MKSLITVLRLVLEESGTRCDTSTTQDYKTVLRRVEHEGLSFLTITLVKYGKDFEKSLDRGFIGSDLFTGFQSRGGLPKFLSGFLRRVFDAKSGLLLDVPCHNSILALRQITLMFGKVELPCSPRRTKAAFDKYVECEKDVRRSDQSLTISEPNRFDDFGRIGRLLWAELFSNVDSRIYNDGVLPKHGPGATADKLRGNAKYNLSLWTRRLEDVFPHWENIISSESFLSRTDCVTILEPRDEIPVKVIDVPKTLETPRIIAVEPTCMQFMQQGVLSVMVEEISRIDNARNFVEFKSQEPNQRLAREGSITGSLATLDMSEASDRVSNQHVLSLLANHRWLRSAVDATRSRKADVPGHGVIRLAKFASMGSALCFPFEAIVFATVIFVGIERALKRHLTANDFKSFYGRVRVYGDDIIIPVEFVESVVSELEAFGLKVNRGKSFWTGKFRESCGRDYYDGTDVSIVRVREFLPHNRQQAEEIVSAVSLRNQFDSAGYTVVVDYLDTFIEGLIPFPWVQETSSLLGRYGTDPESQPVRHCKDTHYPLVRGVEIQSTLPASNLDDYGALMKWFLKRGNSPFEDKNHLRRAGRPVKSRIKHRWARPW